MTEDMKPLYRRETAPDPSVGKDTHLIRCVFCQHPFDLFAADWCGDGDGPHPSKTCPRCNRCLCQHPSYTDDFFWKEAPPAFRRNGFRKLFLLYI